MIKKSWLFLLPLIAGILWVGAGPTQAAGETWVVTSVNDVGCNSNDWALTTVFSGVDGGSYVAHTTVTAGGKVYLNEDASFAPTDGADEEWNFYTSHSYGPTTGTYPITPGQPMKATLSLERPKGHVLYSWSMVAQSCDSNTLLVNGPDLDQDFVVNAVDKCPGLKGSTSAGCPLRDRSLGLRARYGPKRVVGHLYAAGYPALYAGRTVTIWKVRPGPDRKYAVRTTNSLGKFRARVGKGRYYATSPGLIVAAAGQVAADTSPVVRVR
jgi:hypothetical protein